MDLRCRDRSSFFVTALSALFLAFAFQFSWYVGWLAGLFFMPLAYGVVAGWRFSWWHGVAWGMLFWPLHTMGLFMMCVEHGAGPLRFYIVPLFVVISVVYTGCWFAVAQWLAHFCTRGVMRGVVWLMVTWCYFVWMQGYAFSWLGQQCGYPFALPIVPLARYAYLVRGAAWLGMYGLLFVVLGMQLIIISFYWYRWYTVGIGTLLLLLCIVGNFRAGKEASVFIDELGFVAPVHEKGMTSLDRAQAIDSAIARLREHFPAVTTVLMAESAFSFSLNEQQAARELWAENCLADGDVRLIMGSYCREQGRMYNCLYCLQECRIIFHYVKTSLMLFTECIPPICMSCEGVRTLFTQGTPFCPAPAHEADKTHFFALTEKMIVQPCLCSELFFDKVVQQSAVPILCLVNDSWFSWHCMREYMRLYAKLYACTKHRDLIYVGHYDAFYVAAHGGEQKILGA